MAIPTLVFMFTVIALIASGLISSVILFGIGLIRGLVKKRWKLLGISVLVFFATLFIYSAARALYIKSFRPDVVNYLQENSTAKPN